MNIYKEIKEFQSMWERSSTFGRVFLLFSFLLSLLSIGSIADNVYEFKGFLAYGLESYRSWTYPVRYHFSNAFGVEVLQFHQDLLIVCFLLISGLLKFGEKTLERQANDDYMMFKNLIFIIVSSTFYALLYFISNENIAILLLAPMLPILFGISFNSGFKVTRENKLHTAYILFVYLAVAFIAGVGEGLTRR